MHRSHLVTLAALAAGVFLFQGCAPAKRGGTLQSRAANAEIRLISQSCLLGEVVPCG